MRVRNVSRHKKLVQGFALPPGGRLRFSVRRSFGQGPEQTSDYFLAVYCDADQPFYEIPQGDGRRRFQGSDQIGICLAIPVHEVGVVGPRRGQLGPVLAQNSLAQLH